MQKTFEEYEGQTEGWYAEWYFDKKFAPKYFRELHRYGYEISLYDATKYFETAFSPEYYNDVSDDNIKYNPDRPDVEEFLISNDSVIYVRKDCNFISDNRDFGRTVTIWTTQEGGVKNSWSYDSVVFLKEQVSANFGLKKNDEWKQHVDDLLMVIKRGTVTYQENHITVELIEPRDPDDPSSLVNSWHVILSPALFDHLYDMKN
ncbi:MAG: hypothetical protein EBR30_04650 [Cytophagia bacterium]|nr:hypothetical protein [Cytophagia bacterium]